MTGCPLNNRIPEWLELAAEGRFIEAAAVSQATSNLPEICSRLCPQERLCEGACVLNVYSDPVPIGAIEKFINEYALHHNAVSTARAGATGFQIAVVGSGPAGLTCADELVKQGHAVTVFESLPLPGGLLVFGIPSFKIEKPVVARRIRILEQRGVVFRTGVTVGRDLSLDDLSGRYDAVFLGIGAQKPKALDIPGAQLNGVCNAVPFLVEKTPGLPSRPLPVEVHDRRVIVLGGGDTAMDCLRTALRSGAREARCLYRRDETNMPGSRREYQRAIEEGCLFDFLVNPVKLEDDGRGHVAAVHCVRMALGERDRSGRQKPRAIPGSEFVAPAEVVIVAYGFDPVPFPADSDLSRLRVNEWGGLVVDENQMTSCPGVFSGGDMVRGPSLVVEAVRDARRAAAAIADHLATTKTAFRLAQFFGRHTRVGQHG